MKVISAAILLVFLAAALQGCAFLATPLATEAVGGAQLAVTGASLGKQIRKADVQKDVDASFEQVWAGTVPVLANLGITIARCEENAQRDGGLVEGVAQKTKIKIIVAKLTEKITEIGIWAHGDKALAELIAERINEHAHLAQLFPESTPSPACNCAWCLSGSFSP